MGKFKKRNFLLLFSAVLAALIVGYQACSNGSLQSSSTGSGSGNKLLYFYVANHTSNDITKFLVNGATGTLGSPASFTTATGPVSLAATPDGKFLFAAGDGVSNISIFGVNPSDGSLTSVTSVTTCTAPKNIIVEPTGHYLYVACSGGSGGALYGYAIASGGTLSAISGSPFVTSGQPWGLTTDPQGQFLFYTSNSNNTVNAAPIQANGSLGTAVSATTGLNPQSVATDRSGQFVYVADAGIATSNVQVFTFNRTSPALTSSGSQSINTGVLSLTADAHDDYLFAVGGGTGTFTSYSIDTSTGALTFVTSGAVTSGPVYASVTPAGTAAFVSDNTSNDLSVFLIDAATGNISFGGTTNAGTGAMGSVFITATVP